MIPTNFAYCFISRVACLASGEGAVSETEQQMVLSLLKDFYLEVRVFDCKCAFGYETQILQKPSYPQKSAKLVSFDSSYEQIRCSSAMDCGNTFHMRTIQASFELVSDEVCRNVVMDSL